ncbi:MAG: hypothetical protein D6781_01700 [Verrucomicrobia bacterium]|nr:MAG: hypothetical protein D6781_01700 [Verrucomicrobiota bacterium]
MIACVVMAVLAAAVIATRRGEATTGAPVFVQRDGVEAGVVLAGSGDVAPLLVDEADWPGVVRAAGDLQKDFQRVTGVLPEWLGKADSFEGNVPVVIVADTVGRSALIDRLVREGKLDVAAIAGRWEAFLITVVEEPFSGVERALVIAGSDRRGTIYGIYELSEQIGVSPWYWWADVPPRRAGILTVPANTRVVEAPKVRYRGIFINDEAPAFANWAAEKFGGANHELYAHVFELILRLRGNYLWPAMWKPRAFFDDDPENGRLADAYGVVIGTSHHEPMLRAHAEWDRYGEGPWDYTTNAQRLRSFWRGGIERARDWETLITVGMRGDGDEAMSEETNIALLERIVADQRQIIAEVMGRPAETIPQIWALYKEVQGYYERGMRVPEDVTLLWADDNWGNIRRLPLPEERRRSGGAGVYYHFDYVGGPRNYKWINVTPIAKVWEQMNLAWHYGADRMWIVNVGDIKPMEVPLEFFLSLAWNPDRWPYARLGAYSEAWAARQFGREHAAEVAALTNGYSKLNRHRTPELLAPDTYSLVNYRESERILEAWRDLAARAEALDAAIAPEYRPALY